ncbi:hypothetical protein GGD63_005886 [Bradyrhizobium sp. cir1]|uniref:hypothetical protein n=1 Tax=Bradyrhizobium sp. cir1 TaxID=1445730 RepID=UPI001606B5AF|nr:hypothetical protein [Bradyrhizobium sp. cir1]MBB4373071.1 hypothetical protein [Bradyrhizobium sp. cir1]
MLDEYLARIRARRNNIHRYRRLLKSNLSDVDRQFIERRLTEEQTALLSLSAETFPLAFSLPKGADMSAS